MEFGSRRSCMTVPWPSPFLPLHSVTLDGALLIDRPPAHGRERQYDRKEPGHDLLHNTPLHVNVSNAPQRSLPVTSYRYVSPAHNLQQLQHPPTRARSQRQRTSPQQQVPIRSFLCILLCSCEQHKPISGEAKSGRCPDLL